MAAAQTECVHRFSRDIREVGAEALLAPDSTFPWGGEVCEESGQGFLEELLLGPLQVALNAPHSQTDCHVWFPRNGLDDHLQQDMECSHERTACGGHLHRLAAGQTWCQDPIVH